MTRYLVLLAALFVAEAAFACFAPRGGAEYDQLVRIEKLDAKNQYRVTVPATLEDLEEAEIIVAYSETQPGGIPIYEPYEVLETKSNGSALTATFSVEKRGREKPYIVVMWWPKVCCPCGIQANSGFLDVE